MTLEAEAIGLLAARALAKERPATVMAVFERSFSLAVGGTLITVGDKSLHDGPLTIRLTGPRLTVEVETGQRWTASPDRLRRGDGLTIDLTTARRWQSDIPATTPRPSRVRGGLNHLLDLLKERDLPEQGLVDLVVRAPSPRNAIERSAKPLIEALKVDLTGSLPKDAVDPRPAIGLLGLGPGLTPSGDDLLAGLLITLRHLGADEQADRLAQALLPAAAERTTPVSRAHLEAAAAGYGAAPLHRMLNAIVADDRQTIAEALDAAAEIGHSSGLDAIAGMVLALTAWLPRI